MKQKIMKAVGYLQIILVVFFVFVLTRFSKGPIVYPVYFKIVLYVLLALLSSMGIIFKKKIPFLTTVYLYTFMVMERIYRLFVIFNSGRLANNPDFYVSEIISAGVLMGFCFGIILLVLSKNVRADYEIEKKTVFKNLGIAAVIAFFIGPAYIPIVNKIIEYTY